VKRYRPNLRKTTCTWQIPLNLYGPTETTIWSGLPRDWAEQETIPIGPPRANTCIYILDAHLQPVPVNAAGEIYIGGEGLARGYLSRPDLTRERFITNQVAPDQSARINRTGDLGRPSARTARNRVSGRFDGSEGARLRSPCDKFARTGPAPPGW